MKHLHFIQNSTIVRIQNMSSTIFHVKFWITLINIPVNMWRLHKRMVQTFHHILPLDIRHTIDHLKRRVWLPPVRIDMVVLKSILFKNEVKKGSSKIYIFLSPLDVNKTCSKLTLNLLDMHPNIFLQFFARLFFELLNRYNGKFFTKIFDPHGSISPPLLILISFNLGLP